MQAPTLSLLINRAAAIEGPCLFDIGYVQHDKIQSYQHVQSPFRTPAYFVRVLVSFCAHDESIAGACDSVMSVANCT